jgi:hypothetical protein
LKAATQHRSCIAAWAWRPQGSVLENKAILRFINIFLILKTRNDIFANPASAKRNPLKKQKLKP